MLNHDISIPLRHATFPGERCVRSATFTAIQENLNYRAESLVRVWPTYFNDRDTADAYAHQPERSARRARAILI